jgi:hypothetical protein
MYKAKFTKDGARRMGLPELFGHEFEYESISPHGPVVLEMYYKGRRIGSVLSYTTGVLITRP